MPEQIKQYVTHHDIKLLIAIVTILLAGASAWMKLQNDVTVLQVQQAQMELVRAEQVQAERELLKAVQELNIVTVQLSERIKGLEKIKNALERTPNIRNRIPLKKP